MRKLKHQLLLVFIVSFVTVAHADVLSERQTELRQILLQDCGSCHGMTLKGGLGPALTVDAIADKPRELLVNTVTYGRPGTPMPPWNKILSPDEINYLIDLLYEGVDRAD